MRAVTLAAGNSRSLGRQTSRLFMQTCLDQDWRPERSVTYTALVFQALRQAKIWGVIRDNVAESVKPPPVPDHELPILQPDRARELLEALRGRPFYLIASLALATGMRRNEILGLRWRDVDLDAGRLRVEAVA